MSVGKKYQENYSLLHGKRILDERKRFRKAKQILLIIQDYVANRNPHKELKEYKVLDVGCSSGMMDYIFADYFNSILGIEIDGNALEIAEKNYRKENITYQLGNIDSLKVDKKYDLVICNSVLEHVPDQRLLLKNIYNHLKTNGICFLSVPNKFTICKEPHYDLFLLSWFPKAISNLYIRITGKGKGYYETPPSYWKLKNLCSDFVITDYTIERMRHPEKYALEWRVKEFEFITKLPLWILSILSLISPSFVYVLSKKK
jgi:2-polyprenyl-3-methyl-5-hydroxy-6-metoxy-1,4-benzoquinol methylase